jgi:hypothetical protein
VLVYVPYADLIMYDSYRMDSNIDDNNSANWYKKGVKDLPDIKDSTFVWKLQFPCCKSDYTINGQQKINNPY